MFILFILIITFKIEFINDKETEKSNRNCAFFNLFLTTLDESRDFITIYILEMFTLF